MPIECMNFGVLLYTLEGNLYEQYHFRTSANIYAYSGPHHGHYVTIIKSNGNWMLFDDDVVTVSKYRVKFTMYVTNCLDMIL